MGSDICWTTKGFCWVKLVTTCILQKDSSTVHFHLPSRILRSRERKLSETRPTSISFSRTPVRDDSQVLWCWPIAFYSLHTPWVVLICIHCLFHQRPHWVLCGLLRQILPRNFSSPPPTCHQGCFPSNLSENFLFLSMSLLGNFLVSKGVNLEKIHAEFPEKNFSCRWFLCLLCLSQKDKHVKNPTFPCSLRETLCHFTLSLPGPDTERAFWFN